MLLPGPAQVEGTGAGGGVPDGGTTGQILAKLSNADEDAGWVDPGVASNATPLPASGAGGPGSGIDYSRDDHFHPATAEGGSDAYTVVCAANPTSGDVFYFPWANASVGLFNDSRDNSMPFRVTQSATFHLGVRVTAGGAAGSLVRLGVFDDDDNGRGPGTLLADLGTIISTASQSTPFFTTATVALAVSTRYWAVVQSEGGAATQPTLSAAVTIFNPAQLDAGGNPGQRYNWSHSGAFTSFPSVSVDPNPMPCVFFKVA